MTSGSPSSPFPSSLKGYSPVKVKLLESRWNGRKDFIPSDSPTAWLATFRKSGDNPASKRSSRARPRVDSFKCSSVTPSRIPTRSAQGPEPLPPPSPLVGELAGSVHRLSPQDGSSGPLRRPAPDDPFCEHGLTNRVATHLLPTLIGQEALNRIQL